MTLAKLVLVLATVTLVLVLTKILYVFRARAMRSLAASWGFNYIGPPEWWSPSHPKTTIPLPGWFLLACHPSGRRITRVWNVIEGHQNGASVLIFDSILGKGRSSAPCTVIACESEKNPFGIVERPDRVIQTHGWTVLHGVWFLWFSWTMGIKRVDHYVKKLRVG